MVFSTAPSASVTTPISSSSEHSFGVRALAFSPDSRWICSVGNLHDGFIYVWSIHPKSGSLRLQFSNKCTSYVQGLSWMGTSVVTVGTRHVKVWRLQQAIAVSSSKPGSTLDSPSPASPHITKPRAFAGRNCLLGPLIDAVFTCIAALSDVMAILGTEAGLLCLLDDSSQKQQVLKAANVGFSIKCMSIDQRNGCLWVGGNHGQIEALPLQSLINRDFPSCASRQANYAAADSTLDQRRGSDVLALAIIRGRVVKIDSDHIAHFMEIQGSGTTLEVGAPSKSLMAHRSAVLGLTKLHRPNQLDSDFLTWSADGTVYFWNWKGQCQKRLEVAIERHAYTDNSESNVLKVVRALDSGHFIVIGDSMGVLMLIKSMDEHKLCSVKAHSGEINDIATVQRDVDLSIVASAGRDRIIQIFRKVGDQLIIMQTLDDHIAAVCQLIFLNEGSRLLSSSVDRTVNVRALAFGTHESMAYVTQRVLSLNKSPVAFSIVPNVPDTLLISTTDKQISSYEMLSGRLIRSTKTIDPESHESLLLSSIKAVKLSGQAHQSPFLIGVSSSDKSIGLYELESGALIAKAYGHTEGISDCDLLEYGGGSDSENDYVVSTGHDGLVMIWNLSTGCQYSGEVLRSQHVVDGTPCLSSPMTTIQPLRRILSRPEMQSYQRSLETNGETLTPTSSPSPTRIRRNTSRYTMSNAPKLTPPSSTTGVYHTKAQMINDSPLRRMVRDRSPTPPSTKSNTVSQPRRPSLNQSHRTKSADYTEGMNDMTRQLCKALRTFREKFESSSNGLGNDLVNELDRELTLTIRTVSDKTCNQKAISETAVVDLLDVYSEEISQMIDEKVAASVARQIRPASSSIQSSADDTIPSASGALETVSES